MRKVCFLLTLFFSVGQLQGYDFSWASPKTLSNSGVDAQNPQITIDASGNTTVVWVENGALLWNVQPGGGSWQETPQTLCETGASSPGLAMDGSGNVTAIWIAGGIIQASVLPLNGTWETVAILSEAGATHPAFAVDSSGNAVAVWERNGFIESSARSSGNWSAASIISSANSDFPSVAISNFGTAVAVWHNSSNPGGSSSDEAIYSSVVTIGGSWETPKMLTDPSVNAAYPKVAIDLNGNATAAWVQYEKPISTYTNVQIFACQLDRNQTAWDSPVGISGFGFCNPSDLALHVKRDGNGNILAIWNLSPDGVAYSLETCMRQAGSWWGGCINLISQSFYSLSSDLAATSEGYALLASMQSDPNNIDTINIYTRDIYIAGYAANNWAASKVVSSGKANGYPRVAVAADTSQIQGAVIWLTFNGTHNLVQVATGSKQILDPPSHLVLTQTPTSFGFYTDYSNSLSWTASPSPNVVGYAIYRNGIYLTQVKNGFEFLDHNSQEGGSVTYGVAAVDAAGDQSATVTVSLSY